METPWESTMEYDIFIGNSVEYFTWNPMDSPRKISLFPFIIIINEEIIVAFSHKTTRTRYKVKTQNLKLRRV